ncbi:hypothetical protein [Pseudofrankia sp. DC12]|uniref:hypothetical protein n=1 Tax=Pseudofrankia sp. DC12 TaxID=683315 RepID=UPI0012F7701E|nr:hypothetical protein [Pseudofrankia sp. DC12]
MLSAMIMMLAGVGLGACGADSDSGADLGAREDLGGGADLPESFPTISPSPDAQAAGYLRAHLPDSVQCSDKAHLDGEHASISCRASTNPNITVTYTLYKFLDDLSWSFHVIAGDEPCWPDETQTNTEQAYTVNGEYVGEAGCTKEPGRTIIYWTDENLLILASAESNGEYGELWDFWQDAGPVA